jgi:hypothetical protein
MDKDHLIEEFNKAINFALDDADGDGLVFLDMWRRQLGRHWKRISKY